MGLDIAETSCRWWLSAPEREKLDRSAPRGAAAVPSTTLAPAESPRAAACERRGMDAPLPGYACPVTRFDTVRVAAIQATPVILDAERSVEKAAQLLGEAAAQGAQLAVLPETFIPLYPSNAWARQAAGFSGFDELWERLWENSVDVPGPLVDRLVDACAAHQLHCAIGVNERESERPGSLYNTLLLLGPGGLLWKHRKLMPTHHERLFHGFGRGDDLQVTDTRVGRIGGLICWENYMPLARYALYRGGPQIWLAPTMDDRSVWTGLMQTIAMESGAWVVGVCGYSRLSDYPDELVAMATDGPEELTRGGTLVVAP